jgi:tetratricopeptide (TPR) repeat protein
MRSLISQPSNVIWSSVFYLLIGFMLTGNSAYGQSVQNLDSIIRVSIRDMYGNPDKVIAAGREVVNKAGNDINIKIRGYKLISDGYSSKRDYEKSLEYVIKANQLLPRCQDELLKIQIINKAGIQYHQLKIYDKAIQSLDEAEQLCFDYPVRDSVRVSLGLNYIVRGFIYKEKLNCDIAITFFDRGITEINQSKVVGNNASKISIAKYNKGNCYILMSDNEAAIKSFLESGDLAKEVNAYSLQGFALKGLAQVYTLEGKYTEAIATLKEALKISGNVEDLILNQEIYKGLSENYLAVNEWNHYKDYRAKYLQTQLKIKERERKSISDSLNEVEKEDDFKLKNDIPKFVYGCITLFLVAVLIVVFFFLSARKSRMTIEKLNNVIKNLQNEKPLRESK